MFAVENELGLEVTRGEFGRLGTIGDLKAALAAKGAG
jgi:hypothetical protein